MATIPIQLALALSSLVILAECGPVINVIKDKLDESSLNRLRNMYSSSRNLALNSIKDAYLLQNKGNVSSNEVAVAIVEPIKVANSTKEDDIDDDSLVISSHLVHDAPHGRQSAFFPSLSNGFRQPFASPLGGNPFGPNNALSGMMRPPPLPALPSLPAFGGFSQPPPRPPKTSIIGNGGGPMALTNDNVVVVNVFSGNY